MKIVEEKRKLCEDCGDKPAIYFRYDGRPRRDKQHTLCNACFRRQRDRLRVVEDEEQSSQAFPVQGF